jgi:hypothetical protein
MEAASLGEPLDLIAGSQGQLFERDRSTRRQCVAAGGARGHDTQYAS